MSDDAAAFGTRLCACRQSAGLSQEELAERSGVSIRAISNLERGRTRWPHPGSLRRLADALGLRSEIRAEFFAAAGRRLAGDLTASADAVRESRLGWAGGGQTVPPQLDVQPPSTTPPSNQAPRPPVVPRELPGAIRHFVGRQAELAALTGLLEEAGKAAPGAVVITAIGGMAGVGKTTLALHWAHQAVDRFPDGQLYVDLRGFSPSREPLPTHAAVRIFLDGLGVPVERIPTDPQAQVALYRSLLAGKRTLVVIDNARDEQQVRPLLPGSPGCLVVITSRNQMAGLIAVDGAQALCLDVLTGSEARDLLERRLGAARVSAETEAVAQIIERCAGLPLALNIAAARAVARRQVPLGVLAEELSGPEQRLSLMASDALSDLATVFSWSCAALDEPTARMFRLLGLHPGPDISVAAAASLAGVPVQAARRDLTALTSASMLTEHAAGRFGVHDLLRAYAAQKTAECDSEQERDAAVRRMLDHYLHTAEHANRVLYPSADALALADSAPGVRAETFTDHTRALAWFMAERQVLLTVIRDGLSLPHYACDLSQAISRFLGRQGYWQDVIDVQNLTLRLASAGRCDQRNHQAYAYRALGEGFEMAGDHRQALGAFQRALSLAQETGDTIGQARITFSIGGVLQSQGQVERALARARRALTLFEAVGHRSGQAMALNGIGWCQIKLGRYDQALAASGQALCLYRELGDLPAQANVLDNFGLIHQRLGHAAESVAYYRQTLAIVEETGERFALPDILVRAGDAYHAAGDLPAAADAWRRAQAILDDMDHPGAESVRAKLADVPVGDTTIRL